MTLIDLDALIPGSVFFRWREALWCPQWGVCVFPNETQYENIVKSAKWFMDPIRNRLGKPIAVTSWLRPPVYNELIKGAKSSAHIDGTAIDFQVVGMELNIARDVIRPELVRLNIRMEKDDGKPRIHLDSRTPGPEGREFSPK